MGRPRGTKKIKSPEHLLDLFNEYKEWVKSNPLKRRDWVGSMAKEVIRESERPLTMTGFNVFVNNKGILTSLKHYFANTNNAYEDFVRVCYRIRNCIHADLICGAMCGIYNASIVQRIIGLSAKKQSQINYETTVIINREAIKIITETVTHKENKHGDTKHNKQ
jgi:hypothetical protein